MLLLVAALALVRPVAAQDRIFPGTEWEQRAPAAVGLDARTLDELAEFLGGKGCVVRHGYIVKHWGPQHQLVEWKSSVKPVLSTLLFFAIQEGRVSGVDQPIAEFGWDLRPEDRAMTFRHLGAMTSGYARPEGPGEAWAYNDYAIMLYQLTLFDRVFRADAESVANDPHRLGALGFQDRLRFSETRRLIASCRDFARIGWFWLNRGRWGDRQLLAPHFFDDYMRPMTPPALPHTRHSETDDYLRIGSYGGGSDHFTQFGPGTYGFNWWFNDTGRLHPRARTWPDAPPDTFMSIGAGGKCSVMIPSLDLVLVSDEGNWGEIAGGEAGARMNQAIRVLVRAVVAAPPDTESTGTLRGSFRVWEPLTVDIGGPLAHQADTHPNPFLDYRLQVHFTGPNGAEYDVPGFFAGDGEGGAAGDTWRVLFAPDQVGAWNYAISFRSGPQLAVSRDPNEGEPMALHGAGGAFTVGPSDAGVADFFRWGRLEYVGAHYLKFRDGPYWLKGGTDSPEDFLGYAGFANTRRAAHTYATHVADWRPGDPDWGAGQGKGIIGALNYLASEHVNSIYFLPMNIGGDGRNVWPYAGAIDGRGSPDNDNLHFDLLRLHQWGIVFYHAQRRGIFLHFVLNEAEEANKRELDDGGLGIERKLYYRELVARFGHLPALQWNICEEYNIFYPWSPEQVKQFAAYLRQIDPYDHPITVHHSHHPVESCEPFLGSLLFPVTSFQWKDTALVELWRQKSAQAGVPQVIGMDEFNPDLATPDKADRHRREYTWPIYLSGGGLEYILEELLQTDDFRRYEAHWRYLWFARGFVEQNLPFWRMWPRHSLLDGEAQYAGLHNTVGGHVFTDATDVYAIYLPNATQTGTLDLSASPGAFSVRWYNPRTGQFVPTATRQVEGGRPITIGPPPGEPDEDWAVLLERRQ